MSDKVLLGQFGAAHGIRGEVRIQTYTEEPSAIAGYGPLQMEDGRSVVLAGIRLQGEHWIARVKGIADRNAAETLRNQRLFVDRSALPPVEDEDDFYYSDLVGLVVETIEGVPFGKIVAIENFGADDLVEIAPPGGGRTEYFAFTRAIFPTVDVSGGRVVIVPPPETGAREEEEAAQEDEPGA